MLRPHCIFVDWCCPQKSGAWVKRKFPQAVIVKVSNQQYYDHEQAHNVGAALVHAGEWFMVLHCDVIVTREFFSRVWELQDGHFYIPSPHSAAGVGGTIFVNKKDFDAVGGYDANLSGWGYSDDDLVARLEKAGVKRMEFTTQWLKHIEHDNALRVRHFEDKNIEHSHALNVKATWKQDRLKKEEHT